MPPPLPSLSLKSQGCLSITSMTGPSGSLLLIAKPCFIAFHSSKGFHFLPFLFCTPVLPGTYISVLFPLLPSHLDRDWSTDRQEQRQVAFILHPPCTRHCAKLPTHFVAGFPKPLRSACTGAILQMRRLRLTEVYNPRR